MTLEIKAPTFPESIADGTVATWHKQPGEAVRRDEVLVEIETDKVVIEVVAPADGTLQQIVKAEGDLVLSEEVVALFTPMLATASATPAPARRPPTMRKSAPARTERVLRARIAAGQSRSTQTRRGTGRSIDAGRRHRQGRSGHEGRCSRAPRQSRTHSASAAGRRPLRHRARC